MSSIGTAVFDFALYAYPFYQTNKLTVSEDGESSKLKHWLRFWTVVAGLSLVEDIGFNSMPGYYFMKSAVVLGLYSDVHASVIDSVMLRKLFIQYNVQADKAVQWWNDNGKPQISQLDVKSGGWLSTMKNKASSIIWWTRPHED